MDFSPASVRSVISMMEIPPSSKASARGKASSILSNAMTGTMGDICITSWAVMHAPFR